jgi:hypothetical protein
MHLIIQKHSPIQAPVEHQLGHKGHLSLHKTKLFFIVKDILSLEDSNIRNQYDSPITNFYPDLKLNSPAYINANSSLKDSSSNRKVHHQNTRGFKEKISQLSNILYSELSRLLCITKHHLKDLEIDVISIEYYKLGAKFCRH